MSWWVWLLIAVGVVAVVSGVVFRRQLRFAMKLAKALATDDRLPRPMRWAIGVALAVKVVPLPDFGVDEVILVLIGVLLLTVYRPIFLEIVAETRGAEMKDAAGPHRARRSYPRQVRCHLPRGADIGFSRRRYRGGSMRSGVRVAAIAICASAVSLWAGSGTAFAAGHSSSGGQHGGGGRVTVKITNPGNQISSAGQPVQLQIVASDSNGGTLSYSATGLPGGLGIDQTSGVISGTPTGATQSSTQVTALDSNGGASSTTTFTWTVNAGYDISYPQCSSTLPAAAQESIVGVNDGIVYSANPCLGTEAGWGNGHGLQLYANTGDPGPAYSSHWPTGQASPQACTTADLNSQACSFDYGYNAALDSFKDAQGALATTVNPASVTWWLDVETGNSWETLERSYGQTAQSQANDTAALQGEVAGLQSEGVSVIGFYSTSYQWGQITGGTGPTFSVNPAWLAGYSTEQQAQAGCGDATFTGGKVTYTQYPSGGLDADVPC